MPAENGFTLLDPVALLDRVGIEQGWTVADLGCGSLGHFVFPAAELVGPGGRVYAVDVQRLALERLERTARDRQHWHIQTVWSDVENTSAIGIPSEVVDLTCIVNTLYLSSVPKRWAESAWQITKPDGWLLVIDWLSLAQPLGPSESVRHDPQVLRQVFENVGWEYASLFEVGDHHFGLLFHRPQSTASTRIEFTSSPYI